MMYIQVSFPSGLYYGGETYNPLKPEWPPHPSRLFSAFVASAYTDKTKMTEKRRRALEWLESQSPPQILAPEADIQESQISYVPTGDLTRNLNKREHPIHRQRQARGFPKAVIMGKPELIYQWDADPGDEHIIETLDDIAFGISSVGTSHSIAVVKVNNGKTDRTVNFRPDKYGDKHFRTPLQGRLDELDVLFEGKSGIRRPPAIFESFVAYRDKKARKDPRPHSQFLILRVKDSMHGADTAHYLARSLRKAVMSILGDNAPDAVHGHNQKIHTGWIPLADTGGRFSEGRVLGFGLMMPWELSDADRQEIMAAVGCLKVLKLPDGRLARIATIPPGEKLPITLDRYTWTRPSKRWATVTPIVLDRPPKKLTDSAIKKAISQSLVFAGYPEPKEVQMSRFSVFKGAPPAFEVPIKRPRFHAQVAFENPVAGPLIAGRMRYFGIGLFKPQPLPF
jgi:CRISPR-associated protein Csb2